MAERKHRAVRMGIDVGGTLSLIHIYLLRTRGSMPTALYENLSWIGVRLIFRDEARSASFIF